MKIIIWIFYLIGVFFTAWVLHEFYHYLFCGGEWIAGIGYVKGTAIVGGVTWCTGNAGGEIIPSALEIFFYMVFILLKVKYDRE